MVPGITGGPAGRVSGILIWEKLDSVYSVGQKTKGGIQMHEGTSLIPVERIERAIFLIRSQKVMLDRDLAELYGVETRALNQAVRRNKGRFPTDFMLPLTRQEIKDLSQFVISPGFQLGGFPRAEEE